MVLSATQKLILAFVTLILGAVLVGVIATQSLTVTAKINALNESHNLDSCMVFDGGIGIWSVNESDSACNFTITNNPTSWKIVDCPLTGVIVDNLSVTAYSSGTDYNLFADSGVIQILNTTSTQSNTTNDTFSDYTYCQDDYMNLSWGRSLLNLVAGFFAIALLLVGVGLFFSIAKDYGIIGR